jgi:Flp pilus assembly protein TadG
MFAQQQQHGPRLRVQRGAALIFLVVGLTALLLAAAFALDVGHTTLNESRLQNAVDAAALAAAKIIDNTAGNTLLATTEASIAFGNNANSTGNTELASAYANGTGPISIAVTYSATLPPFTPGSPVGPYVRVVASGYQRPTWFAALAGISQVTLSASAVAGPSPTINNSCNLAPLMVCGTPPPSPTPPTWNYGYTPNAPTVMKLAAPGGGTVGPGNFQLIQLGCPGAACVEQNLAGGFHGCESLNDSIPTQTGDETGPVFDGLNTRFGIYAGNLSGSQNQTLYPPDVITTSPSPALTVNTGGTPSSCTSSAPCIMNGSTVVTASNIDSLGIYDYNSYEAALNAQQYTNPPTTGSPPGRFNRRILSLPVANCATGGGTGSVSLPIIGFACFYLLQPPTHVGNTDWVLGQYVGSCDTDGTPGPSPIGAFAPHIIQLYRDPSSGNS